MTSVGFTAPVGKCWRRAWLGEETHSSFFFPVVWGMDTLDPSHGLVEQPWASDRDKICRRNEVSLHSMEVLQPSCGSEAGNLGFVGLWRGRRLIPGLAGADWSITTVVRPYTRNLHPKILALGMTLTHPSWFPEGTGTTQIQVPGILTGLPPRSFCNAVGVACPGRSSKFREKAGKWEVGWGNPDGSGWRLSLGKVVCPYPVPGEDWEGVPGIFFP